MKAYRSERVGVVSHADPVTIVGIVLPMAGWQQMDIIDCCVAAWSVLLYCCKHS